MRAMPPAASRRARPAGLPDGARASPERPPQLPHPGRLGEAVGGGKRPGGGSPRLKRNGPRDVRPAPPGPHQAPPPRTPPGSRRTPARDGPVTSRSRASRGPGEDEVPESERARPRRRRAQRGPGGGRGRPREPRTEGRPPSGAARSPSPPLGPRRGAGLKDFLSGNKKNELSRPKASGGPRDEERRPPGSRRLTPRTPTPPRRRPTGSAAPGAVTEPEAAGRGLFRPLLRAQTQPPLKAGGQGCP